MSETKEIQDVLVVVNKVAIVLIKNLKDGLQPGKDALAVIGALMADEAFKKDLAEAVSGFGEVGQEFKDIDAAGVLALVQAQIQMIPALIDAFKASVPVAPQA